MSKQRSPRGNLESRGNRGANQSLSRGFGIVRMLTPESAKTINRVLSTKVANLPPSDLRRTGRLHATIIGFVGMTKGEQAAFAAGFSVKRLEERLEAGVAETTPRMPMDVVVGAADYVGNLIYCQFEDPRLDAEQITLAGRVAMHGIAIQRINREIVPPHMAVGFGQTEPIEDVRQRVEEALAGRTVRLQTWEVYPERYS